MSADFLKIKENLNKIGINSGDKVLVHSSFKSMGISDGGGEVFIDALKATVGSEGTLLFPAFSYDYISAENPVFDVKTTPCCVGYIPNVFLKSEGVKRSVHPTHSVAVWGKDADFFIANHSDDNVCAGKNSPLFKLKDVGGKILMVGCGITHKTLIHGVECFYKPPYAFGVDYSAPEFHREYTCIDENGDSVTAEFFHEFMEPFGYEQDYDKLCGLMDIKEGKILNAQSYLMDAKTVWETVLDKMKKDPFYFVKKKEV